MTYNWPYSITPDSERHMFPDNVYDLDSDNESIHQMFKEETSSRSSACCFSLFYINTKL